MPSALRTGSSARRGEEKTCATLYPDGTLITGNPKAMAMVEGVHPEAARDTAISHISFNALQAKLAGRFLSRLGPVVEVTLTTTPTLRYTLRDPESENKIVLDGTEGRFALDLNQVQRDWTESSSVDRKTLLVLTKSFAKVAGLTKRHALYLTFRGQWDAASLHVSTTEVDSDHRCSDEFAIYRDIATDNEALETAVSAGTSHVLQALNGMEAIKVQMSYDGSYLKIAETSQDTEGPEEEQDQKGIVKSLLLRARHLVVNSENVAVGEGSVPDERGEQKEEVTPGGRRVVVERESVTEAPNQAQQGTIEAIQEKVAEARAEGTALSPLPHGRKSPRKT